jgi:uncharacterized protein YwqG
MPEALYIDAFAPVTDVLSGPQTKFGGQPIWMRDAVWPISPDTGKPIRFLGQIDLAQSPFHFSQPQVAYLFLEIYDSEFDRYFPNNYAVIFQPHTKSSVQTSHGPSVSDAEYTVVGRTLNDPSWPEMQQIYSDTLIKYNMERFELFNGQHGPAKVGGVPVALSEVYYEEGKYDDWHLLLQIPECDDVGDSRAQPFRMNYGDGGTGWFLMSKDLQETHFSWTSG